MAYPPPSQPLSSRGLIASVMFALLVVGALIGVGAIVLLFAIFGGH